MYEIHGHRPPAIKEHLPSVSDVEGTGKGSIKITRTLTSLSFVNVNSYFRQGIPFVGQVG